jgi:hypothetical protein
VEGSREHDNEPSGSIKVGKFSGSCVTGGVSRRAQLHGVGYVCLNNTSVSWPVLKSAKRMDSVIFSNKEH